MQQNSTSWDCERTDALPAVSALSVTDREKDRHLTAHHITMVYLCRTIFHLMEDGALFPRPYDVSVQVVTGARYRHFCKYSQFEDFRYFCYTLSGEGGFSDASGTYSIPAGHAFLVEKDNADASYYYPTNATVPWRFLAFNFNGLPAHAIARALIQKYGPVYELPLETPIIERLLAYQKLGHGILNIHVTDGAQLVTELLFALMAAGRTREEKDPVIDLVRRALPLLSNAEESGIQSVAQRLGVSREHLSRCFQRQFGISPRQFCLEHRIRKACILLKDTDKPIKQIAAELGYADYNNFAHAFHQITHMTATEFRLKGSLPVSSQLTLGSSKTPEST